jgi:type I restriction enzyme S subunit
MRPRPKAPTSIGWLKGLSLPTDWAESKVKYVAPGMQAGATITAEAIEQTGTYPVYGGNGLRGFTEAKTHAGTRILIGRQGALCGNVHLVAGDFWASEHAIVARPCETVDPRWLAHLLRVMNLGQYSQTAAQPGIGTGQINPLPIPLPRLDEQHAIADYLDRETARIDTLIEEQQRLIEMLRERRRSIASDLLGDRVGKGARLKWSFDELDRRAGAEADTLPLMSVSISWGVRRRDEVTSEESRAEDLSNYKICRQGDLVINRMRAFQGALGLAHEAGLVSPDYAVLRARPDVDGEWLAAVMKSDEFVSEMRQRVKGIGSVDLGSARTPRINIDDLGEIRIDFPDVDEQRLEVRQHRTQAAKVDTLLMETERFVELSRERRWALITAAVTGQIDVRAVA